MKKIKYLQEKLINHRKSLHCIAEIGNEEYKTSKYIKGYLDSIGVKYETFLETAIVGKIKGKNPKKTIAFRSDIDGLTTDDGVEHLCGHDGHMSILLGLVEYLQDHKGELNDNIVFIFQPAEEGPGGALPLIEAGVLKKYEVDEIYGLHIYPEVEQGYIGIREGYFLAQSGEFDINITAKSGHGAMPQKGIDGIVIAANLISNLQTIVARNISPIESSVITIGRMEGGSIRNIIAENVKLEGTMRTFDPEVYKHMKQRMCDIAKGFELAYNCKIDVEINDSYPAVNNDKKLYEEFVKVVDNDKIVQLPPLMIAEDFSYYQQQVPGLFIMLGSRNEEKGFVNGLHNINFNFDEEIFGDALEVYLKVLKHKNSID